MKHIHSFSLVIALMAILSSNAAAQMAPPVPMTPQHFSQLAPGANVEVMIRVDNVRRQSVEATILQRKTDTNYKATATHAVFYLASGTPMIMGSPKDVSAGAVLYVYGILTKPAHVDIKKIVVVTQYTKVD